MKKLFASFGWILLLLPFLSFAGTKAILGSGTYNSRPSEERTVSGFNAISSGGAFDVHVTLGNKESLRIEGDEDQLSKIETKVENGTLKIRYKVKSFFNTGWKNKVTVFVTAKSLKSLSISGSGNMDVSGMIKGESLDTRVSGSGSISFSATVNTLNAIVSGSGELKTSGSARTASISVSGSGDFEGKDFKTTDSNIKVSGSGNVTIYADKNINAKISGSGNVRYAGNPTVNISKSGSGDVSKL